MKNSRKNTVYRLILCAVATAAMCTGAGYATSQSGMPARGTQGKAAVQQLKITKGAPALRILDSVSDGTTADVRIAVKPIDSEQAAENLMITASTGSCGVSVLEYDERSKQAVFVCSVDCKGMESIKLFVQGDGVYDTVPVTVLKDKSVQTHTPLTSASDRKGTLDEIRVNTHRISFQYTLPGYLEPSTEWDTDWKEYVYGTPDVTVTFADGSEKQLKPVELYGEQDAQNFNCYTHYFEMHDGIDLKHAQSLTVNGTEYTLH